MTIITIKSHLTTKFYKSEWLIEYGHINLKATKLTKLIPAKLTIYRTSNFKLGSITRKITGAILIRNLASIHKLEEQVKY